MDKSNLDLSSPIFVAGHQGMVGSAIVRRLKAEGYLNIITRKRSELDLTNQNAVKQLFKDEKIEAIIIAAAKVGGIYANNEYPAEFIYQNLMIECNVIHEAYMSGVKKLLFLGSSCIYPKMAEQPITEESLLTGKLEPTNEPYAIAKIAGIKLCESYNRQYGTDFRSVMPTNLYGPKDNFHEENSHVIPALIRRFHEAYISNADSVDIWGSGKPRREFLHVDDMANASLHVFNLNREKYDLATKSMLSHINIGSGEDITIFDLAKLISEVVGYKGQIVFNESKPDGVARKLMDVSKLKSLGWRASIPLKKGLEDTYAWYINNGQARR